MGAASRGDRRMIFRASRHVVLGAVLAGALLSGCKLLKRPAPAPAADTAKLEAQIGQLADSLRLLAQAQELLTMRIDSLGDTLAIVASRRGGGGGGGGARKAKAAPEESEMGASAVAGDTVAAEVERQKVIYANYKLLKDEDFEGDTIHTFLAKKYGVDSTTVEAIRQRGEQEGW
jgi:hypothetical protein